MHGLHSIIGSTIKEIPLDVFFLKRRQKLCFISFIKKELLTKFDEIHYTSTNGSEKPSLAVSNNSNVLPPQTAVTVTDKQAASVCVRGAAK